MEMLELENKLIAAYKHSNFRQKLAEANSYERWILSMLPVFGGSSKVAEMTALQQKLFGAAEKLSKKESVFGGVLEPHRVAEDIQEVMARTVSRHSRILLRACLLDAFLRLGEVVFNEDFGWLDARGFQITSRMLIQLAQKRRDACPDPPVEEPSIIVGICWPPRPGRSNQGINPDCPRFVYEGGKHNGRSILGYWQLCGEPVIFGEDSYKLVVADHAAMTEWLCHGQNACPNKDTRQTAPTTRPKTA